MPKLISFTNVTLDGYFAGANGDLGWAHSGGDDAEWNAFVADNAKGGGRLLFGRVTYEMMLSYWPSPMAAKNDPVVAAQMNALPKVVFSRTLATASWNNTKLVKHDIVAEVRKMKSDSGEGMAILGSGSIVAQLAEAGLIDEFQVVVNPFILGAGKTLFAGVKDGLRLKHTQTRTFANGKVFLSYEPMA